MDKFLALTFAGLCTAGIYAIAASGLVLTYTTTGVFNFAHGATGMLGAFTYWQLKVEFDLPTPVAVALVLLVIAPLYGAVLERVIMRGLQGTSDATQLVVTVSLLAASLGLSQWIWSPQESHPLGHFWEGNKISIGPVNVTWHATFAFLVSIVVALALRLLLFRTRAGVTMRATVDDRPLVTLNGGQPDRSAMLAWAIGCSLAALAGILAGTRSGAVPGPRAAHRERVRGRGHRTAAQPAHDLPRRRDPRARRCVRHRLHQPAERLSGRRSAPPSRSSCCSSVLIVAPAGRGCAVTAPRARESDSRCRHGEVRSSRAARSSVATAVIASMVTDSNALTLMRGVRHRCDRAVARAPRRLRGHISLCQMSFAGIGAVRWPTSVRRHRRSVSCGPRSSRAWSVRSWRCPRCASPGIYLALATGSVRGGARQRGCSTCRSSTSARST